MSQTRLAVVATHPIQYQTPLWKALVERGVHLRVYYATRHGLVDSHDREFGKAFRWDLPLLEGYPYEFCESTPLPGVGGPVQNMWPRGLRATFARERYDAVLVHGYATGAALAAIAAAWATGCRVMMRGDTHDVGRGPAGARGALKRMALGALLPRIDAFLAVGRWNRDYWIKYGAAPERVSTATYSVDNDRFSRSAQTASAEAAALRAQWGAARDDTVFIYCGKLIPKKAPDVLLEGFARLGDDTRLVMVGSGELESELKRRFSHLGNRVIWAGFVNQGQLPQYYAAADAMVLPSRFEPWGLVVNEAMACGLPCIVSDVVAAGEDLVRQPGTGVVFRTDDVASLEGALRQATRPEKRLEWASRIPEAIDRAHNRHVVDAIIAACR